MWNMVNYCFVDVRILSPPCFMCDIVLKVLKKTDHNLHEDVCMIDCLNKQYWHYHPVPSLVLAGRSSPPVLSMWPCKLKLVGEKLKQRLFGQAKWFCRKILFKTFNTSQKDISLCCLTRLGTTVILHTSHASRAMWELQHKMTSSWKSKTLVELNIKLKLSLFARMTRVLGREVDLN
jgi:hypothetical protein